MLPEYACQIEKPFNAPLRSKMQRSQSPSNQRLPPPPSDFFKPRPRRGPGETWQDGLINAMSDPEQIFETDELTVTLKDAFPKARYHLLIVPREEINSVSELSAENIELLKHIHKLAEDLISRVHKKEPNLSFRFGYHAVPSMKPLHLHIISQDFNSPKMRTAHHWNTFNTEYFIDSKTILDTIEKAGQVEVDEEKYEALLTLQMRCNHCKERFDHIQALKDHLLLKHDEDGQRSSLLPRPSIHGAAVGSSKSMSKRRKSCMY